MAHTGTDWGAGSGLEGSWTSWVFSEPKACVFEKAEQQINDHDVDLKQDQMPSVSPTISNRVAMLSVYALIMETTAGTSKNNQPQWKQWGVEVKSTHFGVR